MSALDSFNLGDFLRIGDQEENRRRVDSFAGLTLSDILLSEKRVATATAQTQSNRTLLDVIGVPESSFGVNVHHNQNQTRNQNQEKKTWKAIKDRLLLKRNGAVLTSSSSSSSDIHSHRHNNNITSGEPDSAGPVVAHRDADGSVSFSRRGSGSTMRLSDHILLDPTEPARLGSSRRLSAGQEPVIEEALSPSPEAGEGESDGEQPVRMSLMELLEETMEVMGSRYDAGHEEEEVEKEGEQAAPAAAAEQKCCVCMVRHKGAAFTPCGHTFCRVCSRELFVQRGNCPLCNAEISEILDIF